MPYVSFSLAQLTCKLIQMCMLFYRIPLFVHIRLIHRFYICLV
nr:MAG TPA: hypothetical protein [Caudoviricetes sp.]